MDVYVLRNTKLRKNTKLMHQLIESLEVDGCSIGACVPKILKVFSFLKVIGVGIFLASTSFWPVNF